MLKIRLKRAGKKNKPFFKIVIMQNLTKRNGKTIADIGYYNPIKHSINLNNNALYKFISYGAQPTNTVRHLIFKTLSKNLIS